MVANILWNPKTFRLTKEAIAYKIDACKMLLRLGMRCVVSFPNQARHSAHAHAEVKVLSLQTYPRRALSKSQFKHQEEPQSCGVAEDKARAPPAPSIWSHPSRVGSFHPSGAWLRELLRDDLRAPQ